MVSNKQIFLVFAITVIFTISFTSLSNNYNNNNDDSKHQAFAQTDASAPDAVTDLIAISGKGQINLSWTAPDNNGSPIVSYNIIRWETDSDIFTTFPNLSANTSVIATGLKNDISYSFKVIAVNAIGHSNDSNVASAKPSTTASATGVPNPVTDLIVTRGDTKATMKWTKPNDHGSPITSYRITYWQVGTDDFNKKIVDGTATSAQVSKLTNNVSYAFKINAVNSVG